MTRLNRTICSIAEHAGIQSPRIEQKGRKHPRLIGELGGRKFRYVVSGSPGDRRSLKNLQADLRRIVREARI